MSRILIISPVPTHPTSAGNRARILTFAQTLMESGHTVFFMHLAPKGPDSNEARTFWKDAYYHVPYEAPSVKKFRRLLNALRRRVGFRRLTRLGIDDWYDPKLESSVSDCVNKKSIDTVVVEYVYLSRILLSLPKGILKVLDTHDVFANRDERYLANGLEPTWFSCSASQEAKGLNRADLVIAIQDLEAEYFKKACSRPVVTIGHPVTLIESEPALIVPGRILLIGSSNPINVASASWFISEVLPDVLKNCAQAELVICGNLCNELDQAKGVELRGRVDELAPIYATAQVVVNPTLFGTGLKIKSIEAMGYQRPLVTTECGAEGLKPKGLQGMLVARNKQEFSRNIISLLNDPESALEIGKRGYEFARQFNARIKQEITATFPWHAEESLRSAQRLGNTQP